MPVGKGRITTKNVTSGPSLRKKGSDKLVLHRMMSDVGMTDLGRQGNRKDRKQEQFPVA